MSITAKYAATCSSCHGQIAPGQSIEWQKGQPVRHTSCTSAASRRRGTRTGCSCGSVEEFEKPSDCWTCRHDR